MSKSAELTLAYETDLKPVTLRGMATKHHPVGDIGASISSGSFLTMGMLIAPCSIRTMSEIATGVTSSLLTRAADVVLKERRRLVLAIRETPLHVGHLRTMTQLAEMGAVVAPIVPVSTTVRRVLMTSSIKPLAGFWTFSALRPALSNAGRALLYGTPHRERRIVDGRRGAYLTNCYEPIWPRSIRAK